MDLETLPQTESEDFSARAALKAGKRIYRRRKKSPSFGVSKRLASGSVAVKKADFLRPFYERRRLLTVPKEILDSNPDKHFCFVSMTKLQKSGMWHQMGYQLYNCQQDPEAQNREKFNNGIDNYVHRNEMVLAYLTKEEFEHRQLEFEVARGKMDYEEVITKDPNLSLFGPHAKHTHEEVPFPKPKKISENVEKRI